jgi:hypothetical protein
VIKINDKLIKNLYQKTQFLSFIKLKTLYLTLKKYSVTLVLSHVLTQLGMGIGVVFYIKYLYFYIF